MMKERRCNLFDDNGRPRRLKDGTKGCFRDASTCRFAHPHERAWETAHPSLPPKHDAVVDDDSDFYYILLQSDRPRNYHDREREKDREWDRDRDKVREREREKESKLSLSVRLSSPHRRDGMTTCGSPGLPSQISTLESTIESGGTTKRTRSPSAISSTSDQLDRSRRDMYRIQDLPPPRRNDAPGSTSRRSRPSSKEGRKHEELIGLPAKAPPAAGLPTARPPPILPPEPPKSPPMQPPPPPPLVPPIPKLPPFVSNQQSTSMAEAAPKEMKELSMDEQRSAWHERIDLMFTSITSRRDYLKLESDLAQISLLSNSPLFINMHEDDRASVNAQKMALELQKTAKRTEINETIQKLIGSSFWPILRTAQISEMEKALAEAKKHILEVRGLLEDVRSSCTALFKTSASDCTQDSDRPFKRRKLDSQADTPVQPSGGSAEVITTATVEELEEFHDKLTVLDCHLIDLQNDIMQRDRIVSDEIELHIDARLEEEDALYPRVKEPRDASEMEIEATVDAKNKEIVRAVTQTGEEIGALAVEVAELITKVDTLEAKCRALEAENQEFKQKLSQDTLQHAKCQDDLLRRGKEIEAIAAALQAFISQTPADRTAGDLPSAEYIIESLVGQLDGLFREKFGPKLSDVRQEVFGMIQDSHNRTIDTVSPKISLLLRMVNLIAARVGKPDMDRMNAA